MVPFNKPYLSAGFIRKAAGIFSGPDILRNQGHQYNRCKQWWTEQYAVPDLILTPSCTAALELAMMTIDLQPGDEVILPSYTYVSTANAIVLRGAIPVFADSYADSPHLDPADAARRITSRTRAIITVHYGGTGRGVEKIATLCKKHRLQLVEDAAHAIGATYRNRLLGTFGDLATFSFHETKNITCGQGGALLINNTRLAEKAHILSQCGTDRWHFMQRRVTAYTWISPGSNYLLAEPLCALLSAQLQKTQKVNSKRISLGQRYRKALEPLRTQGKIQLPPEDANSPGNGHIFYFYTRSQAERDALIRFLAEENIAATFHYQPLHGSPYHTRQRPPESLPQAERAGQCLVRLPMYYDLQVAEQRQVIRALLQFYSMRP